MENKKIKNRLLAFFAVPFLFTGCVSLVEKAGRAIDGSAFEEKTIAVYKTPIDAGTAIEIREVQNKAGQHSVIIAPAEYPALILRGSIPDETGEFYLTAMDYLGGNSHGWNEYRLELSGSGTLSTGEKSALFFIHPEIEAVQIVSGRIRRFDTRITGNEALTNLNNRRERILALAEWMNGYKEAAEESGLKDFEKYWKPLLFPELVYKSKRPEGWQREGDQWQRTEDIRWNTSYTERLFPELLRGIRDSGTMLRDWEEALDWLYITYNRDRIIERFSKETFLERVK